MAGHALALPSAAHLTVLCKGCAAGPQLACVLTAPPGSILHSWETCVIVRGLQHGPTCGVQKWATMVYQRLWGVVIAVTINEVALGAIERCSIQLYLGLIHIKFIEHLFFVRRLRKLVILTVKYMSKNKSIYLLLT